jgi:hypothetical protein
MCGALCLIIHAQAAGGLHLVPEASVGHPGDVVHGCRVFILALGWRFSNPSTGGGVAAIFQGLEGALPGRGEE